MGIIPVPLDPISAGLQLGASLIERIFPDPAQRDQAKLALLDMQQKGELAELAASTQVTLASADIIKGEIASNSWLGRNWRPVVMLILMGLVTARWFGWSSNNLHPEEYSQLWTLVQIGIGGYLGARSVEKVVPAIVGAIVNAKAPS